MHLNQSLLWGCLQLRGAGLCPSHSFWSSIPQCSAAFVSGRLDFLKNECSFASAHRETFIPRPEPTILCSFQKSHIQDSCAAEALVVSNPVVGVKSVTESSSAGNLMARSESDPEHLCCRVPRNTLVTPHPPTSKTFNVLEVDKSVPKLIM